MSADHATTKFDSLAHLHYVDVWTLLLEQTPPALIFLIVALFGALIWALIHIWQNHRARVDRAIAEHKLFALDSHVAAHHEYMDEKIDDVRDEFRGRFDTLQAYMKTLMDHFIQHIEKDKDKHDGKVDSTHKK